MKYLKKFSNIAEYEAYMSSADNRLPSCAFIPDGFHVLLKNGTIPDDYLRLEYIESTGTQWIDTGITLDNSAKFEFKAKITASTTSGVAHPFYGTSSYTTGMMGLYHYTNNNYYGLYVKSEGKSPAGMSIPAGSIITHTCTLDFPNHTYACRVNASTGSGSILNVTDTSSHITIFKGSGCSIGTHKCYYFTIYKNGICVRRLLPCIRKSDGAVGMYDKVSEMFFSNSGSGVFAQGPEKKSKMRYYTQVNYIQFEPGQYINTELFIPAGSSVKAETVIKYAPNQSVRDLMGYSTSGGGYWGVNSASEFEGLNSRVWTSSTDITRYNFVSYRFSSATENGNYRIGMLVGSYSTRTKYISSVKIYVDGVLSRDMVAATRNSDSKAGMYDRVTQTFYTNSAAGTGDFIYG